ncbi:hypothetical protein DDQ41_16730 [Streptomyces spongiicola]|uniref:Uncharacterized protein n=2 Tax=Streptomyces spongiicola TaxID=1690221 RepID=A0ABM6V833_9ACTN|nr:hypothetical protein DDQ41_16730 [Streptomyces spongiicola]
MRLAQSALDEAQADRTRMLAAFAVVVGDDGTVAGMMGLPEREVRVARRTVGREGARTVAANLLTRMSDQSSDTGGEPAQATSETPASFPRAESAAAPAPAPPASPCTTAQPLQQTGGYSIPAAEEQTWAEPVQPVPPAQPAGPVWSPSMDSVLVWSWHSGLDLQVVANELGLELRTVLQRVQTLAAEGQLVKADQVVPRDYMNGSRDHSAPSRDYSTGSRDYSTGSREYSGRHRRHREPMEFSDTGSFGLGGLFSSASWS